MEQFNDTFTIDPPKVRTYVSPAKVKVKYAKPPKRLEILNAEGAGHIVSGFGELEAKEACKVLFNKYPGIYYRAMINEELHERATIQAVKSMLDKEYKW